jgi:hypothetical protein
MIAQSSQLSCIGGTVKGLVRARAIANRKTGVRGLLGAAASTAHHCGPATLRAIAVFGLVAAGCRGHVARARMVVDTEAMDAAQHPVRRFAAVGLGALLALALLAALWPAIAQAGPRVRGQVRDATGRPIAGAQIVAAAPLLSSWPDQCLCVTDSDGRFAAPWPPSGRWLRAEAGGFVATALDPAASAGAELHFALAHAARIAGRVIDASGAPGVGLPLELIRDVARPGSRDPTEGARVQRSAADGSFEFECQTDADYVLTVCPGDRNVAAVVRRGIRGGSTGLCIELTPSLLAGTAIGGRVLGADGSLVRDCSVTLVHHWSPYAPAGQRRTSRGSAFAFDRVPTGELVCLEVRTDRAEPTTFGPFAAVAAAALELRLP